MDDRFKSGSRNPIEKRHAFAMGRIGKTHGVCMTLFFLILLYFTRFVKDFSTFSVSWAVVQLIFCPLGNREVRIGFTTSANPSARMARVFTICWEWLRSCPHKKNMV